MIIKMRSICMKGLIDMLIEGNIYDVEFDGKDKDPYLIKVLFP